MMSPNRGYMNENGDSEYWNSTSDSLIRNFSDPRHSRGEEPDNHSIGRDISELLSRSASQEAEILLLRKQISDASLREILLLNEKHISERTLTDLRMVLDEKQIDAVSGSMRELTQKRSYLEENMRMSNDLKTTEEEIHTFNSSLLSLLADFSIRPNVINASTISNATKRLYHHLHWKTRSYELNYNAYPGDNRLEAASKQLKSVRDYDIMDTKEANVVSSTDMHLSWIAEKPGESSVNSYRRVGVAATPNFFDENAADTTNKKLTFDSQYYTPNVHETQQSSTSEGEFYLPGIEGFQIVGEARPGSTLRACGYPVHGTSLCIFQWFRHNQNGTRESIEGATVPDYVVTADDVDAYISVDCIPMDDNGRQGDLVTCFANNQNKITCDPDMQHEINSHITAGKANFNVSLWRDSSEVWEQSVLFLRLSNYQIKIHPSDNMELLYVDEKYSPDLHIKVPHGLSAQFVVISSDGFTLPFSTEGTSQPSTAENDIRLRDIIVLTMRNFQTKALDAKRKGKV